MFDRASIYTLRETRGFIVDRYIVVLLDQLLNSLDLNPIKNVQALIKDRVQAINERPYGGEAIMDAINRKQENLTTLEL